MSPLSECLWIIGAIVVAGISWFGNAKIAQSARENKEQDRINSNMLAEIRTLVSKPETTLADVKMAIDTRYDAPIWKAFEHVASSINESRTEYDLPKTRSLIRQKAIDGHLKIWGKKQLDGGLKGMVTRTFDDVVTEIPKQYWNISKGADCHLL